MLDRKSSYCQMKNKKMMLVVFSVVVKTQNSQVNGLVLHNTKRWSIKENIYQKRKTSLLATNRRYTGGSQLLSHWYMMQAFGFNPTYPLRIQLAEETLYWMCTVTYHAKTQPTVPYCSNEAWWVLQKLEMLTSSHHVYSNIMDYLSSVKFFGPFTMEGFSAVSVV